MARLLVNGPMSPFVARGVALKDEGAELAAGLSHGVVRPSLRPQKPRPPSSARQKELLEYYGLELDRLKLRLRDEAAGVEASEEQQKNAAKTAASVGSAAATVVTTAAAIAGGSASVPVAGQIAAAIAAVVALIAGALSFFLKPDGRTLLERTAGANVFGGIDSGQVRSGWFKDACYFWEDWPCWGPALEEFIEKLPGAYRRAWLSRGWEAFEQLVKAYPWGPPVPEVRVTLAGDYDYRFNINGTNDLSDAAIARREVWAVVVYSPRDIRRTGPRNFNPDDPQGWRVPGQKLAKADAKKR